MNFIIGDIHGEINKLKNLISYILLKDKNPELIFIGDYIDKGENSFKTLQYLSDLKNKFNCTFICGNHEYLWLKMKDDDIVTQEYLLKYGARLTIESLNVQNIFQAKRKLTDYFGDFFSNLIAYWKNENYIVVHSGIKPEDYSLPIESLDISRLIFNRYDFLKQEKYYLNKYKIIFGHTGFFSPYVDQYKIGVDTSACFMKSQPITAFSTEDELFIDSSGNSFSLKNIPKNQCPNINRTLPPTHL